MSNPYSWYARYPRDYGEKTAHLSLAEHGAYTLLLDHYMTSGGAIAIGIANAMQAASVCYRICRAQSDDERAAVDAVVRQYFTIENDGYLHNKRADIELGKRKTLSETRASVAKKGAAKRWGNPKPMPNAMPIATAIAMPKAMLEGIANGCTSTATTTITVEERIPPLVPPKGESAKRARQLPDDFAPNDGHRTFAVQNEINLADELVAFRDFHLARGNAMKDWDAALRTWLRNANKFAAGKAKPAKDARFSAARNFDNVDYHKGVNPDGSF